MSNTENKEEKIKSNLSKISNLLSLTAGVTLIAFLGWLDGENIYSLKPSGTKRITKTVGSNWVMLPLYRTDAGKEIRVEITPVYESFRDREVEFLIGSSLAIYTNRLSRDLPQLILGIMAVFVGVVFVCATGYNLPVFLFYVSVTMLMLGMVSVISWLRRTGS